MCADYGVREPGYKHNNKFVEVPEMIPEIMVPDLKDFKVILFFAHALVFKY